MRALDSGIDWKGVGLLKAFGTNPKAQGETPLQIVLAAYQNNPDAAHKEHLSAMLGSSQSWTELLIDAAKDQSCPSNLNTLYQAMKIVQKWDAIERIGEEALAILTKYEIYDVEFLEKIENLLGFTEEQPVSKKTFGEKVVQFRKNLVKVEDSWTYEGEKLGRSMMLDEIAHLVDKREDPLKMSIQEALKALLGEKEEFSAFTSLFELGEVDVNLCIEGEPLLCLAIEANALDIVKWLLEKKGVNVKCHLVQNEMKTPLYLVLERYARSWSCPPAEKETLKEIARLLVLKGAVIEEKWKTERFSSEKVFLESLERRNSQIESEPLGQ